MAEELQVEFCEHVESPLWILIIYMPVLLSSLSKPCSSCSCVSPSYLFLCKPFTSCSCKRLSYLFPLQALLIVFLYKPVLSFLCKTISLNASHLVIFLNNSVSSTSPRNQSLLILFLYMFLSFLQVHVFLYKPIFSLQSHVILNKPMSSSTSPRHPLQASSTSP